MTDYGASELLKHVEEREGVLGSMLTGAFARVREGGCFPDAARAELRVVFADGSAYSLRLEPGETEIGGRLSVVLLPVGSEKGPDVADAEIVMAALRLCRERVTGDDLAAKQFHRDKITALIDRINGSRMVRNDSGAPAAGRPTRAELEEIFGEAAEHGNLGRALARWDG